MVQLTAPPKAPLFGISFLLWRTLLGSLASLILVLHTVGGGFGGLRDQLRRIGSRTLAASTATNVVGNLSFTCALGACAAQPLCWCRRCRRWQPRRLSCCRHFTVAAAAAARTLY